MTSIGNKAPSFYFFLGKVFLSSTLFFFSSSGVCTHCPLASLIKNAVQGYVSAFGVFPLTPALRVNKDNGLQLEKRSLGRKKKEKHERVRSLMFTCTCSNETRKPQPRKEKDKIDQMPIRPCYHLCAEATEASLKEDLVSCWGPTQSEAVWRGKTG